MGSSVSREILPLPEALPLDVEQKQKLDLYKDLLLKWNKKINLIAPASEGDIQQRHIKDALQFSGLIPKGTDFLDMGSGGGLPAIPLAIALKSKVTLIESDARKCAFLREACRVCNIHAEILTQRIESLDIARVPVITARALAPLPKLIEWCKPLLKEEGFCLFPKGKNAENELTQALLKQKMIAQLYQSKTCSEAVILKISDLTKND